MITSIWRRWYYTNRCKKVTLYTKLSPLGQPGTSVRPELEGWIQKGKKVRVAELLRIVHDLRKRKRFSQALEVSKWMNEKGICVFSPSEHAVQLDLIGRVNGYVSAESYFSSLRDEERNDKTYGALLNCYVRQRLVDKALSHLEKMKEMGFATSPLSYNDIMCLYTNLGEHEKVPEVLSEMKNDKVFPDNFSYRICINSFGTRSDIEGMEGVLKEMEAQSHIVVDWNTYVVVANFYIKEGLADKAIDALKKSEERIDMKNGVGYNHLISLYAKLGNKDEILRLWHQQKIACKRYINRDFITVLESLLKLGELAEAEKLLKEWESSGNSYDFRVPGTVVRGYCEKGLYTKAELMLNDMMKRRNATTPNIWGTVAGGYLDKGKVEKALECLKVAISLRANTKGWKPAPPVISGILNWLVERNSPQEVKTFVDSLRSIIPANREMYHALIKAALKSGEEVDGIVESMKRENINEDEETRKILQMRHS